MNPNDENTGDDWEERHRRFDELQRKLDAMSVEEQNDFHRKMGLGHSLAWKGINLFRKSARKLEESSPYGRNIIIDRVIEYLGKEGSIVGTSYRELSYDDVVNYIRSNDCRITTSIENPHEDWTEFERVLSGQRYQVTLSRTHGGAGAVLTSKKI